MSHPDWVDAMIELISRTPRFFRWHDSGDIVSFRYLENIMKVCIALPSHKFWLPTHELSLIRKWVEKYGNIPDNVTVRLSAQFPGEIPYEDCHDLPVGVLRGGVECEGHRCPAPHQDNKCKNCRMCWSRNVPVVSYDLH